LTADANLAVFLGAGELVQKAKNIDRWY
jgi:hypothetical protein